MDSTQVSSNLSLLLPANPSQSGLSGPEPQRLLGGGKWTQTSASQDAFVCPLPFAQFHKHILTPSLCHGLCQLPGGRPPG